MRKSPANNTGAGAAVRPNWLRRVHRWLGIVALVFVLLLAVTGIALNHADDWHLNERYVAWDWVLAAYGLRAPSPEASFAGAGHRATLLGDRLYFDERELASDVDALTGIVAAGDLVAVSGGQDVFLLTPAGMLIERLPLDQRLPGTIAAIGLASRRVVIRSKDALFRFDDELANLEPWPEGAADTVRWSAASPAGADELAALEDLYRGRGIAVERLLADLHSGRLFTRLGPRIMDAAAVLLILLGLTGLWIWLRRGGNGQRRNL